MTRAMLAALLSTLSIAGLAATMPPVRMKIVDAQDGTPVAGALVLFHASAQEGTFTGHGGKVATLFVAEAATDDAGEVRFPKQEFPTQPFFLNTNYHNPTMVVLKPGYALLVLANTLRIIPKLDEVKVWQYDNQTVKLARATKDADRAHAATLAGMYADATLSERTPCAWKSIPRFLVAADRAAREWNRTRKETIDPELRHRAAMSPLEKITANEKHFVEKGCGSPRAFFEPYLR